MFKHRKTFASVAPLLWAMAAGPAIGMSSGSIVFDPTNYAQTTTTAANSIKQVTALMEQLKAQYAQLDNLQRQAKSMEGAAKIALGQANFGKIAELNKAIQAYEALGRSVSQARNVYQGRIDEARLMGVSWKKYLEVEQRRVAENRDGAAARIESEYQTFKRVEDDYAFAREVADRIPSTDGIHAAQQQTNAILNRMLTQNADVMKLLAQANGAQKAAEITERVQAEQRQRATTDYVLKAQRKMAMDPAAAKSILLEPPKGD